MLYQYSTFSIVLFYVAANIFLSGAGRKCSKNIYIYLVHPQSKKIGLLWVLSSC